jgi:WD40 repeat protein
MHTAIIWSLAVDSDGRFAVTGSAGSTVKIWSTLDGQLLRTIRIPVGPEPLGQIFAVAISPDGSTIAAGGWTERLSSGSHAIYLFDRESGGMIRRIDEDLPEVINFLTFSPNGRYLAATLGEGAVSLIAIRIGAKRFETHTRASAGALPSHRTDVWQRRLLD